MEEVEATKIYGVELGDDALVRIFGSDVAFQNLVKAMRKKYEQEHPQEAHP
jgi:hypothetical protein